MNLDEFLLLFEEAVGCSEKTHNTTMATLVMVLSFRKYKKMALKLFINSVIRGSGDFEGHICYREFEAKLINN